MTHYVKVSECQYYNIPRIKNMWKNVSICVSHSPHPPLCPDILCVKIKMIMFALRMAGVQSKMSGDYMARTVSIGNQGFERIRKKITSIYIKPDS